MKPLPKDYQILPYSIPFVIPGFKKQCPPEGKVLAPESVDCEQWFESFAAKVIAAIGKRFLPICRMSDGEFKFLFGEQPPSRRLPWFKRVRSRLGLLRSRLKRCQFDAFTAPGVSSGRYSLEEVKEARLLYGDYLIQLYKKGIMALHLSYVARPFQENYFPALGRWVQERGLELTIDNYVPFYFVYALLTGKHRQAVFEGRRVLMVNGADGEKQQSIINSLKTLGAKEVLWCPISSSRSLYDKLDVPKWQGKVDLAVVGAGVGKPNILVQMEPLKVPCIDAGFLFEVWTNYENRWRRPMCVPDKEFDHSKML